MLVDSSIYIKYPLPCLQVRHRSALPLVLRSGIHRAPLPEAKANDHAHIL